MYVLLVLAALLSGEKRNACAGFSYKLRFIVMQRGEKCRAFCDFRVWPPPLYCAGVSEMMYRNGFILLSSYNRDRWYI